jgi:cyanophycin synthetase
VIARLDITRSAGVRYAARRRRESGYWDALHPKPRDVVYADIWQDAAREFDVHVTRITPSMLEFSRADASVTVMHQVVPLDASHVPRSAVTRAGDKPYVQRLMRELGIPVPESLEFPTGRPSAALDFMREDPRPVFVKPARGLGGWGVTGGIRRASQMARAIISAARYADRALVERAVPGDIYRLLYLDGAFLGAVRRRSPTLVGDGHSTVLQLVHAENRRRMAGHGRAGLWLLRIDLDALFSLEHAGLTLASVPPRGMAFVVKATTAENCLADNVTVDDLSPVLVDQVGQAVRALDLRVAGVDLATPDVSKPLAQGAGAIIEVNENPGLSYHYLVADPARAKSSGHRPTAQYSSPG